MATPFTVFRNYSGILMAALCAMLMVAFVVADPLMQYMGGGGGGGGRSQAALERVVSWDGGSLNERQLADMVLHRRLLANFQQAVYELGARDAQASGVQDLSVESLRVKPLELPTSPEQGVERDVVFTKLVAERAQKAGMVVSDEAVLDYLRGLGRDRVSSDQMRDLLGNMSVGGRRATIEFIFNLLREAILKKNYTTSHQFSFFTVLPQERWADWLQGNERIVLEVAPIDIEKYLDKVPEPTDAEIEEYFEANKLRDASPDVLTEYGNVTLPTPTPGFATPPQVKLQYLVAEFDQVATQVADEVTDEEIAAFYEENREQFIEADEALFGEDAADDEVKSDAEESDAEGSTDADQAETDQTDADPSEAEAAEATPPTDDPSADDSNPLRSGSNDSAATEEEEEEEEEAAEETSADKPADGAEPATGEGAIKYQPLDEVKGEIRRVLAERRAADRLQTLMEGVKRELDDAHDKYFDAVLDAEDAKQDPPAPPKELADLGPIAEKHGLKRVETEGLSLYELSRQTIGRSMNADEAAKGARLWMMAFAQDYVELFDPILTYDIDGNRYLTVVTERTDRVIPELKDVRDKVVAQWKRAKAAELALEDAKKLASAAQESGKSLSEHFADDDAINATETDPFAFLTIGDVPNTTGAAPLRLSQPEPLASPGPELMKRAFELAPGEVGAALNHDRSIVYLMRVAQKLGTPEELRGEFKRDPRWFGLPATLQRRVSRSVGTMIDDLFEQKNVEWDRSPDTRGE
jgi:hypothetical protein